MFQKYICNKEFSLIDKVNCKLFLKNSNDLSRYVIEFYQILNK